MEAKVTEPKSSTPVANNLVEDEAIYTTNEAADILRKAPVTMRNSRWTGKLCGVDAPAHLKIGSRAYYRGATLKAWLAQFEEKIKASEAA